MFDIGFSELLVIGLVALIVLGPERLPKLARTVGHLIGRMQRYAALVKADIEREIQLEELKKLEAQLQAQALSLEREMQQQVAAVQHELDSAKRLAEADTVPAPIETAPKGSQGAQETATIQARQEATGTQPEQGAAAAPELLPALPSDGHPPKPFSAGSDAVSPLPQAQGEARPFSDVSPAPVANAVEAGVQPAKAFLNNGLRS